MSTRTSPWPAGVPCWADVTAPDLLAAKTFYAAVLGWTYADTHDDEPGGYAFAQVSGRATAGVGPLPPGGGTAAWTLYLASPDVDATAAAVRAQRGEVLLEPSDIGPLGRMLLAADPTGAVFGVWQAGTHIGSELVNEPGALTWEDLRSPRPDDARAFYGAVFGYRFDSLPDAGPDYSMFALPPEEAPLGGMGGMFGAEDVPPHWLVYFAVADAAAAVAAAEEHGGGVLVRDLNTPYGTMAGLTDPAGATFWVVEPPEGMPRPQRED